MESSAGSLTTRRYRPVVRSVRHPARLVVKEPALDSIHLDGVGAGAVARCDPPTVFAIARELAGIVDRVLLLHIRCAAGVLEIVDTFVAHERILNAAKVDPDVRSLMREQRAGIQVVVPVTALPLVGGSPSWVTLIRQRMRWRTEPQDIQHEGLVVALPPPFQESAFRLPSLTDRSAAVLRPGPVSAAIERVGEEADFLFRRRVRVEICARSQRAGKEYGAVHGREFTSPRSPTGLHVEKVVVEAVVAGGIRFGALPAVPEESQSGEDGLGRRRPRDEPALDGDWIRCQGEPGGGYAGGPIGRGLVEHQSVLRIGPEQKVVEGFALKRFQFGIDCGFVRVHGFTRFRLPPSTQWTPQGPPGAGCDIEHNRATIIGEKVRARFAGRPIAAVSKAGPFWPDGRSEVAARGAPNVI